MPGAVITPSRRAGTALLLALACGLAVCPLAACAGELIDGGDSYEPLATYDGKHQIAKWWVGADFGREGDPALRSTIDRRVDSLEKLGLLDPVWNNTLVNRCFQRQGRVGSPDEPKQLACPVGLVTADACCMEDGLCRRESVAFPSPRVDHAWPEKERYCSVQQVCSRCLFTYPQGSERQFRIVQANDPMYLPYTCSKVCGDGCAVLLYRSALVAQAMRFVSYSWEWVLLGVIVSAAVAAVLLTRFSTDAVVNERHKVLGVVVVGLIAYGAAMVMLAAAGLPGFNSAWDVVTRTLGSGWQYPVYITGAVMSSTATAFVTVTALDLAVSRMLAAAATPDRLRRARRTRSGNIRFALAVSTLRFETLATVSVGCLVSLVLVLITPAKFDSNRSWCLVYSNVPEAEQSYTRNFETWIGDATATDQMVSIWLATAYTVCMFFVVWSLSVALSIARKLVLELPRRLRSPSNLSSSFGGDGYSKRLDSSTSMLGSGGPAGSAGSGPGGASVRFGSLPTTAASSQAASSGKSSFSFRLGSARTAPPAPLASLDACAEAAAAEEGCAAGQQRDACSVSDGDADSVVLGGSGMDTIAARRRYVPFAGMGPHALQGED